MTSTISSVGLYILSDSMTISRLVTEAASMGCPTWSLNSQYFAVDIYDPQATRLWVFDRDESNQSHVDNPRQLIIENQNVVNPAWSPDGQLFVVDDGNYLFL